MATLESFLQWAGTKKIKGIKVRIIKKAAELLQVSIMYLAEINTFIECYFYRVIDVVSKFVLNQKAFVIQNIWYR